ALLRPGRVFTRHLIAVTQMLWSALLINVTGGRIETHFHVFGSLAFIAFYRDWRVLVPATLVVAADHLARGYLAPQSPYGLRIAAQYEVARTCSESKTLAEAMPLVFQSICQNLGWDGGVLWRLNAAGTHFGCTAAWQSDSPDLGESSGVDPAIQCQLDQGLV